MGTLAIGKKLVYCYHVLHRVERNSGGEWVKAVEEKVELASVTQLNTSVSVLGRERNGKI